MSNVVKAAASFTGTDQPAVVGKILEQLYTDSSGNLTVRYLRAFKADEAVTANSLVGCAPDDVTLMHRTGTCGKTPATGNLLKQLVYGISISTVASGEWGFVVCRGVCENVPSAGTIEVGLPMVSTSSGVGTTVDDDDLSGTPDSASVIGVAISAASDDKCSIYIDVL